MASLILVALLLVGSPPEPSPRYELYIHFQKGREAEIIKSELQRSERFFRLNKYNIERNFKIILKDDGYKRTKFQFTKNGEKYDYPISTFNASGTFILTTRYLCDLYMYEVIMLDGDKEYDWGYELREYENSDGGKDHYRSKLTISKSVLFKPRPPLKYLEVEDVR